MKKFLYWAKAIYIVLLLTCGVAYTVDMLLVDNPMNIIGYWFAICAMFWIAERK